jgi:hypothetical protein
MKNTLSIKVSFLTVFFKFLGMNLWEKSNHIVLEEIDYDGEKFKLIDRDMSQIELFQQKISSDIALLKNKAESAERNLRNETKVVDARITVSKSEIDNNINFAVTKIINEFVHSLCITGHASLSDVYNVLNIKDQSVDKTKVFAKLKKRLYNEFRFNYINNYIFDEINHTVCISKK